MSAYRDFNVLSVPNAATTATMSEWEFGCNQTEQQISGSTMIWQESKKRKIRRQTTNFLTLVAEYHVMHQNRDREFYYSNNVTTK